MDKLTSKIYDHIKQHPNECFSDVHLRKTLNLDSDLPIKKCLEKIAKLLRKMGTGARLIILEQQFFVEGYIAMYAIYFSISQKLFDLYGKEAVRLSNAGYTEYQIIQICDFCDKHSQMDTNFLIWYSSYFFRLFTKKITSLNGYLVMMENYLATGMAIDHILDMVKSIESETDFIYALKNVPQPQPEV